MNPKVTYNERSLLGGWHIEVILGQYVIGTIRKIPSPNFYGYFHGPHNFMTPKFAAKTLDELKKLIEASKK